jgi:hypothetical protein
MAGSHEMTKASTKKVISGCRARKEPPAGFAELRSALSTLLGGGD